MRTLLLLALLTLPAQAQTAKTEVEVELVLLADASGSISPQETLFQRQGYADALTDPRVLSAVEQSIYGQIAVIYVEWAAHGGHDVVVPWTLIVGADTAQPFARALLSAPKRAYGRNAIGSALKLGVELIYTNAFEGARMVIDFSGDSANSWNGPPIIAGRETARINHVTVNALPLACIACDRPSASVDLERRYAEEIITGPGAFVLTVRDGESLADAIRRKLVLEISGQMPPRRVASR